MSHHLIQTSIRVALGIAAAQGAHALAQSTPRFTIGVPGHSVDSIADLNGDGVRDLLIGIPSLNTAEVRSGRNGNLIGKAQVASFPTFIVKDFGRAIVAVGDLTGDGLEEIAVGAPSTTLVPKTSIDEGRVFVFSGASTGGVFPLLATINHEYAGGYTCPVAGTFRFGTSLARVGDVTGDGLAEIAIGTPTACVPSPNPRVQIWDVAAPTPQVLASMESTQDSRFGLSMCSLGDVIPDGLADLAVGEPGSNFVRIYSGQQLAIPGGGVIGAWTVISSSAPEFGFAVANADDVSGDGIVDLLTGAPGITAGGSYYVHSGAPIPTSGPHVLVGPPSQGPSALPRLGCSVSSIGDYDNDGVPDFVLGAEGTLTGTSGYVRVISGATYATLLTIFSPTASPTFGVAVSETGNAGGAAGKPPFVVADPAAGNVYVY